MRFQRAQQTVQMNGERYVRYSVEGGQAGAVFVHERYAAELMPAIEGNPMEWQTVWVSTTTAQAPPATTTRMQVFGGWLVKHTNDKGTAMVFVRDEKHLWKAQLVK